MCPFDVAIWATNWCSPRCPNGRGRRQWRRDALQSKITDSMMADDSQALTRLVCATRIVLCARGNNEMRDVLEEYFVPTDDQFADMWANGVIVLDTNVLLDVFRYTPATSAELLRVLTRLKDQLWIPYQVALEYLRDRNGVVDAQLAPYEAARKTIEGAVDTLAKAFPKYQDTTSLLQPLKEAMTIAAEALSAGRERRQSDMAADSRHEELSALLLRRVGSNYSGEELETRKKEALDRAAKEIPPGYKDAKKEGDRSIGDVLAWFQMLDFAAKTKKPIIFITGDAKEDWWWRSGGKTLGARPELRREMLDRAGVRFHMYNPENFLSYASRFLKLNVASEAIDEGREAEKETREPTDLAREVVGLLGYTTVLSGSTLPLTGSEQGTAFVNVSNIASGISGSLMMDTAVSTDKWIRDGDGHQIHIQEIMRNVGGGQALKFLRFRKGAETRDLMLFPANWRDLSDGKLATYFELAG
jgi:hypothetical protein